MSSFQPWWRTDTYDDETPIPAELEKTAGPHGVAVVRAWATGKTDPGWGLEGKKNSEGFMARYKAAFFHSTPIVNGFLLKYFAFAFVMRSMKVVCLDIDGKNGGFEHVGRLGMLPYTLAETSKSGDGYHLYFLTEEDEWNDLIGFGMFADRIGIEQGVDLRATGCVYHFSQQRWNRRLLAELPDHLKSRLRQRAQAAAAQTAAIVSVLTGEDTMEVLMLHSQLLEDLKKPIPAGRRNTTLFAIGTQLKLAQVPDWETALLARSLDVGLSLEESNKIVLNVSKYGVL
jgi:hypothetical protein